MARPNSDLKERIALAEYLVFRGVQESKCQKNQCRQHGNQALPSREVWLNLLGYQKKVGSFDHLDLQRS